MFVFTANDLGVRRFEKILGITPKAAQSLDDRKIYIISMMNRRKMSLSELAAMLSNYSVGIELINDMAKMEMLVHIKLESGNKIYVLNKIIDDILPLNIYYKFCLATKYGISISYKNAIQVKIQFWPRHNQELLRLNGRWKLDGTCRLSGYDNENPVDFYPVRASPSLTVMIPVMMTQGLRLETEAAASAAYHTSAEVQSSFYTRKPLHILLLNGAWNLDGRKRLNAYDFGEGDYYPLRAGISCSAEQQVKSEAAQVRVINNLDGSWKLDGSRKLNSGIYSL